MKQVFLILGFYVIAITGCTKKDLRVSTVADAVSEGTWKVNRFSERGEDETNDFSAYSFIFQSNGKIQAIKDGVVKEGTWSEHTSSKTLTIYLGAKSDANKPLGELTGDWFTVSKQINKIHLAYDNSSDNVVLEFVKN